MVELKVILRIGISVVRGAHSASGEMRLHCDFHEYMYVMLWYVAVIDFGI